MERAGAASAMFPVVQIASGSGATENGRGILYPAFVTMWGTSTYLAAWCTRGPTDLWSSGYPQLAGYFVTVIFTYVHPQGQMLWRLVVYTKRHGLVFSQPAFSTVGSTDT